MRVKNYSIKRVANIKLSVLKQHDWWRQYESQTNMVLGNRRVNQPRHAVISGLKRLFPEWENNDTFNFHWDKRKQFENIKLYVHVPKVTKVEMQHVKQGEGERQGEIQDVSNALLRTRPVLD